MIDFEVSQAILDARQQAALARMRGWGWLQLSGPDRLDFLQRLSTNDFRGLAPGKGLPTVITSSTGHVQALLIVYAGTDTLYIRTEPGQAAGVARYLGKMIFWNDHIEIADAGSQVAQWAVYGPAAHQVVEEMSGETLDDLHAYSWRTAQIDGVTVSLHCGGPLEVPKWTIVGPATEAEHLDSVLTARLALLEASECRQLRVEAGIPAWDAELNDQVTPLEAGLIQAVHFNKGCYTGQEVIARQYNYEKISRLLVGLLLPVDLASDVLASLTGAKVQRSGASGGGRPGFAGSVVRSAAMGRPIALAVVPRDAANPGTEVVITYGDQLIAATVTSLPFPQQG